MVHENNHQNKLLGEIEFHNSKIGKPLIELTADEKLLRKVSFYRGFLKEPNVTKNSNVFKNYARI